MKSYRIIAIVAAIFFSTSLAAQQPGTVFPSLKQTLGLKATKYKSFADSLQVYNKQQIAIQSDTTKKREQQKILLNNLWAARKSFVEKYLDPTQQAKFQEYQVNQANLSPRNKIRLERQEKMRKKGMKVVEKQESQQK